MRASAPKTPGRRLYIFAALLFVWVLVICFRLVRLQVVKYGDFVQRAQRQQNRTIPVQPRRGNIYDRNGYALAMSIDVDSVFAVPSEVHDQETTAVILGRVLDMAPQEIVARLQSNRNFAFIKRKIDEETANRVRELNLRGIYFRKEPKRFYPKRELAAQVLGYVGMDDEGLGGLERQFDDDLRGIPGQELISIDARRKWFSRVEKPPDPGQNLVLTIDQTIQYIAEKELDQGMADTKAIAGTVVVENPRTGEILALVNRPTFNPNVFNSVPTEALKNRAVSDIYEPGSVFKIVTYSAAIDQHVVTPDDKVDCQHGSINVFGMQIHDHESLGVITIAEALAHSSDVAAIKVGMKLGDQRLYHYIHDYGFGQQTGIELPGETRGMAKPVNRWSKVSIGAISMGQEIGVTPLQTISLVSTIANDGVYTPPRIVAGELPPDSKALPVVFHPAQQHRVVSAMTAVQMKKMMEGVVLFGTARRAILEGYTIAGKTGTAQKVEPGTGAYSKTKYVASFIGFTPVNTPAITIAVILDSPVGLHQGGQVCAPVFKRIAQQVLEYLHVPHDLDVKTAQRQTLLATAKDSDLTDESPDHLGAPVEEDATSATSTTANATQPTNANQPAPTAEAKPVATALAQPATETALTGTVAPTSQSVTAPPNGTVILDVDSGTVVPSFLGKPLRLAVEIAQQSGLEINAIGSGIAREQWPAPGSRLTSGEHITVRFGH
ncbi:MAG: penicillin-binding transpeptidase domain-containing protein [Candidatus Korobacteraceae bacterium]|jgi:cell division protein FtsI (penicillin-binding protein 3)